MHTAPHGPEATLHPLHRPRNRLLTVLPRGDLERLNPHLESVAFQRGSLLHDFDQASQHVYFIESGLVSLQVQTGKDPPLEVGLVGRMGLIGAPALLGTLHAPVRAVTLIAGEALAFPAGRLTVAMTRAPALRHLLFSFLQAITTQTAQLVLCNARHETEQRLARWLLLAHDRLDGDEIPITQGTLGNSLGVRRPSITDAVNRLQDAGLLKTQRACISILDRQQLEQHTCDCYHVISREYARLFERSTGTS